MRNALIWLFLSFGASLAQAGAYDNIIAAANNGDTMTVVDLLKRGMDVNTADPSGTTLLMISARLGNLDLLETLLANRASVNRRNQFGDTALLLAVLKGQIEAVQALIDKGADLNSSGWTPLHYTVFADSREITALLIAKGANLDTRAPNGQTALMLAVKFGKTDLVRQLIDAEADVDLADYEGVSPLQLARKLGHVEIADYLNSLK